MRHQLLIFSSVYLGLFFVFEVAVVVIAFLRLRGRKRVWLWFVIPGCAMAYALFGAFIAPLFISTRAEARIDQIEMQHEGWPESELITSAWQVKMNGSASTYRFPADSALSMSGNFDYYNQQLESRFIFHRAPDGSEFTCMTGASRHGEASVQSWLPAAPPCEFSADGKLTAKRDFKGAWAYDGTVWRDLGSFHTGNAVKLAYAPHFLAGRIRRRRFHGAEAGGRFPLLTADADFGRSTRWLLVVRVKESSSACRTSATVSSTMRRRTRSSRAASSFISFHIPKEGQ